MTRNYSLAEIHKRLMQIKEETLQEFELFLRDIEMLVFKTDGGSVGVKLQTKPVMFRGMDDEDSYRIADVFFLDLSEGLGKATGRLREVFYNIAMKQVNIGPMPSYWSDEDEDEEEVIYYD